MKELLFLATAFAMSAANAGLRTQSQTCGGNDHHFADLAGSYTLSMKIGSSEFLDRLEITSIDTLEWRRARFEGNFTVTGSFSAPVEDGKIQYFPWSHGYQLTFAITARENGQSFLVYFVANSEVDEIGSALVEKRKFRFTGKAYSPTPGREMGSFVMSKDAVDCPWPP